MNEVKELVEELRNKKSRDNRDLLDRSADMIERLAKELCDKSGCHHKCHDTKDCVVEDEAKAIIGDNLPSALKNDEKVSEKEKQIEEMAKDLCKYYNTEKCNSCGEYPYCAIPLYAKALYNAGYRKQSENVIELPCKVGDWIWYVYRNEINKAKVEEIRYDASKHGYYSYSCSIHAYDFKNKREVSYYPTNETQKNKSNINEVEGMDYDEYVYVFLTKEEALAKMKGGEQGA